MAIVEIKLTEWDECVYEDYPENIGWHKGWHDKLFEQPINPNEFKTVHQTLCYIVIEAAKNKRPNIEVDTVKISKERRMSEKKVRFAIQKLKDLSIITRSYKKELEPANVSH